MLCPGYDAPPEADALASATSLRILQLLLQLERASDWASARELALQIDRESRDELPIIPLWQLSDHYAWRDRLTGPSERSRASLYQGIETWEIVPWYRQRPVGNTLRTWMNQNAIDRIVIPRWGAMAIGPVMVLIAAWPAQELRAQETGRAPAKDAVKDLPKEKVKASGKQSTAEQPKEPAKAVPREPIERRPYRVSFHLACDPSARIDAARRAELLQQFQVLLKRFIGPPWIVTIEPASSPLASADLATILPPAFAAFIVIR